MNKDWPFQGFYILENLDKLWDIAQAIGWTPIIKEARENASESWHFDLFDEDWAATRNRLKVEKVSDPYGMTAMCACLDLGFDYYGKGEARALQAQLHRIGQNPGPVDGDIGQRTELALVAAGFSKSERDYTKLYSVRSAA